MLDPDTGVENVISSLSDQMELLNELFFKYTASAQAAPDYVAAGTWVRLALAAQRAYLATAKALTIAYRARRVGEVSVYGDDDDTL